MGKFEVINKENIDKHLDDVVYLGLLEVKITKSPEDLYLAVLQNGETYPLDQNFSIQLTPESFWALTIAPDPWIESYIKIAGRISGNPIERIAELERALESKTQELDKIAKAQMDTSDQVNSTEAAPFIKIIDTLLQNDIEKHRLSMGAISELLKGGDK